MNRDCEENRAGPAGQQDRDDAKRAKAFEMAKRLAAANAFASDRGLVFDFGMIVVRDAELVIEALRAFAALREAN